MRILAVVNQKGGCGKTTTAVNLAAAFAERGMRVLLVDFDPQGHVTLAYGHEPAALQQNIYHVLTSGQIPLSTVILPTKIDGLKLAPSNILLSGAELELANVAGREFVLSERLKSVQEQYDVCVIDCPPSLGLLTVNALVASTDVIVTVQANYYAVEGLKLLLDTANTIRVRLQPCEVKILGLLLTFVEERTLLSRQIQQQMRQYFGNLVFDTTIHRTVRLAEAPSAGEPVLTYAPNNVGAFEYRALAEEIAYRIGWAERPPESEISAEQIGASEDLPEPTDQQQSQVERPDSNDVPAQEVSNVQA
jgi:chromosome partitioning protein